MMLSNNQSINQFTIDYKTSLTSQSFIEVPVPKQGSELPLFVCNFHFHLFFPKIKTKSQSGLLSEFPVVKAFALLFDFTLCTVSFYYTYGSPIVIGTICLSFKKT